MIKKIALLAILGLFVAVFAVNAQTAGTTQPQPGSSTDTADMAKDYKFSGKIDKIDTVAKTIAIKIEKTGEVKVFTFDDKTAIKEKDKGITVEKLKVGDEIAVESDTENLAIKIKVKPLDAKTRTTDTDAEEDDNN